MNFDEELETRIVEVEKENNSIIRMNRKDYIILTIFILFCLALIILGAFV